MTYHPIFRKQIGDPTTTLDGLLARVSAGVGTISSKYACSAGSTSILSSICVLRGIRVSSRAMCLASLMVLLGMLGPELPLSSSGPRSGFQRNNGRSTATLSQRIIEIILDRSLKQMGWIDAWRIVAVMAGKVSRSNGPSELLFQHKSVGVHQTYAVVDNAISSTSFSSNPNPTFGLTVAGNASPETIPDRYSWASHAKHYTANETL